MYQQLACNDPNPGATGWALANQCAVIMAPVEDVTAWAADTDQQLGWGIILDVDNCDPILLPWLGQYNGTVVNTTHTVDEQRRQIREARGSHRGRPSAVVSDIQAQLTGTQFVDLIERDGGEFLNTVVTRTSETPDSDAVVAALANPATKPLGVLYTLTVSDVPIIDEFTRPIDSITVDIDSVTFADVT